MRIFPLIVTLLSLACLFGFVLFGCARPQPMGEDIWIGLQHTEQKRK